MVEYGVARVDPPLVWGMLVSLPGTITYIILSYVMYSPEAISTAGSPSDLRMRAEVAAAGNQQVPRLADESAHYAFAVSCSGILSGLERDFHKARVVLMRA